MKNIFHTTLYILGISLLLGAVSCKKFTFLNVSVPEDRNPLLISKTPTSKADTYFTDDPTHILIDKSRQPGPDLDPGGAFENWATCLIMIKEGHNHGQGKLHGNFVYPNAPWKQEQFIVIRNTTDGIKVEVDRASTKPQHEEGEGKDYLRIIGGASKLWGACLYFYDKDGKLINDKVYDRSDEYQIFFSISELDENGQPYEIKDVRFRNGMDYNDFLNPGEVQKHIKKKSKGDEAGLDEEAYKNEQAVASKFFQDELRGLSGDAKLEKLRRLTPEFFVYTYRDTWRQDDMGDGVRTLYNIRLLPPFIKSEYAKAAVPFDQDYVGLKGHFKFDFQDGTDATEWPIQLPKYKIDVDAKGNKIKREREGDDRIYKRPIYTLPQFCIAVQIMRCEKGKKLTVIPGEGQAVGENGKTTKSPLICQEYNQPDMDASGWKEITRFNIPVKVYTTSYDSDPTNDLKLDAYEPYYLHLGREIGLTPQQAFDAVLNVQTHGAGTGGSGLANWFL